MIGARKVSRAVDIFQNVARALARPLPAVIDTARIRS